MNKNAKNTEIRLLILLQFLILRNKMKTKPDEIDNLVKF